MHLGRVPGLVATSCFEHAVTAGDISLCMYDVTTLYFEAEHEDALRKVGYSNYADVGITPKSAAWIRKSSLGCWSTATGSL